MPDPSSSLATVASPDGDAEPRQRCSGILLLHLGPQRIVGGACLLPAAILVLPISFGNIPPDFAVAAFSLGILERDGMATIIGWLATFGSVLILAAISSAIIAGIRAFLDQLWVLIG
jgi:hypothetical protein